MASFLVGFCARYFKVTSGSPSRIIRCTMIKLLKTMVHVESRKRFVRARKISATPASPAWVATRMCSTYFDLGAASCRRVSGSQWTTAVGERGRQRQRAAGRRYLDLRPALDALLEGAGHRARRMLEPGAAGGPAGDRTGDGLATAVGAWARAVEGVAALAPLALSQHAGAAGGKNTGGRRVWQRATQRDRRSGSGSTAQMSWVEPRCLYGQYNEDRPTRGELPA